MGGHLDKFTTVEDPITNDYSPEEVLLMAAKLVEEGDLKGLKKVLQKNTKVTTFSNGTTLLHIACLYQQLPCIRYLLKERLVDINSTDNSCETALNSSLVNPVSFECADLLIAAGVNIDLKNKWLRTPLLKFVIDQDENVVSYLINKGANPNIEDCMGCTPLNNSVYYHLHQSYCKLLENGADIDYINRRGNRALDFACKSLNKKAVNILIECGATVDINIFNKLVSMPFETEENARYKWIFRRVVSALGQPIPFSSWTRFSSYLSSNVELCCFCQCASDLRNWHRHNISGGIGLLLENLPLRVKEIFSAIPSLKHISRVKVRQCLISNGGNVVSNIKHLNIPPGLKSVVLLQDFLL